MRSAAGLYKRATSALSPDIGTSGGRPRALLARLFAGGRNTSFITLNVFFIFFKVMALQSC